MDAQISYVNKKNVAIVYLFTIGYYLMKIMVLCSVMQPVTIVITVPVKNCRGGKALKGIIIRSPGGRIQDFQCLILTPLFSTHKVATCAPHLGAARVDEYHFRL